MTYIDFERHEANMTMKFKQKILEMGVVGTVGRLVSIQLTNRYQCSQIPDESSAWAVNLSSAEN